ncbi:hypothetical protein [Caballeronia ptereochthonis]|uniref:hypothetical protein n=1 Tax=Caballeronia ptereochthonis TaxID=1777144 RepID=UPI001180E020|nr:hypothetical protein [Caballeronia ptereochthonis]
MRSFVAADDALPRADPAPDERVIEANVEANERRLMTDGVVHFDHVRRRGSSIPRLWRAAACDQASSPESRNASRTTS